MPSKSSPEGNNQSESEGRSLGPAPRDGSHVEKQIWAFRRYYGIGYGGRIIEEWTQQEIADALGVSRQTIDRWLNRETIASSIVGGLTHGQRLLLYGMIVGDRTDEAEEYLMLLSLEGRLTEGKDRSRVTSIGREESDSQPFDGLNPDFNPW